MALKLRPISYLVLGMVRFGATSGYAIKKAADASTAHFWPTSLAQVYPELARLHEAGLLDRSDDPHGSRSRAAYSLTEAGEEALRAWLRSPVEAKIQMRYEGMLRMFFADALSPEERLELYKRQRQKGRELKAHLFDGDLRGAAKAIDAGEMLAPILLGDFGEDMLDFIDEWVSRLIERFEAKIAEQAASD
ncbi:MAG TPA: PadR family transcriptional regulator [Solirubrobacterales bacterium]|nr:PadR family transcriptional regulator [Solirubrobacterales bacterium]